MKGKGKGIAETVNEALFEVTLILATGLFRARQRMLLTPERCAFPKQGLDSSADPSVHSVGSDARGGRL